MEWYIQSAQVDVAHHLCACIFGHIFGQHNHIAVPVSVAHHGVVHPVSTSVQVDVAHHLCVVVLVCTLKSDNMRSHGSASSLTLPSHSADRTQPPPCVRS